MTAPATLWATDHTGYPPELIEPPACDCCGVPSSYRRGSIWTGLSLICLPCFVIWYDAGVTKIAAIRATRLRKYGRADVLPTELVVL